MKKLIKTPARPVQFSSKKVFQNYLIFTSKIIGAPFHDITDGFKSSLTIDICIHVIKFIIRNLVEKFRRKGISHSCKFVYDCVDETIDFGHFKNIQEIFLSAFWILSIKKLWFILKKLLLHYLFEKFYSYE